MTGLLDIADAVETVPIGGVLVDCNGISGGDLIRLLRRFPALSDALMNGRGSLPGGDAIDAPSLMGEAPDAIAAILAAGTGKPADPAAEAKAARLPIEPQLDLLTTILRLTLPQGLGPFVEKLTALFGAVGVAGIEAPRLPPTGSVESRQPLPNGKEPDTQSPSPSNA